MPKEISEEVRSLAGACQHVQSQVMFTQESGSNKQHIERGVVVAGKLSSALEFMLDDDIEEPADEVLRIAKARQADDASQAQLGQSLSDFAALADTLKDRFAKLKGFDLALIGEAKELAALVLKQAQSALVSGLALI